MDKSTSLSYLHRETQIFDSDRIQLAKNSPIGEGIGYRISAENMRGQGRDIKSASPYIEYRSPYNIFTMDFNFQEEGGEINESYNLSASGAIVYIGGNLGFTRPVDDSFAMIKVDKLRDIPILFNNEKVAKTNKEGIAFLPNLNSYNDNTIQLDVKKLSLRYSLLNDKIAISPPYRYGACINFPIKKIYRYEGLIKILEKDTLKPLSFKEVSFKNLDFRESMAEKELCKTPFGTIKEEAEGKFFTSLEGDFYLENVKPGRYTFEFKLNEKNINFAVTLPDEEEVLINLGEIIVTIDEE